MFSPFFDLGVERLLLLYIIKHIEPSAMQLINIQKDSSDSLVGQIFRLT